MNRRYPFWAPIFAALLVLFLLSKPGATNEEEIHAGEAANGVVKAVAFHAWHPAEGLTEFTLTYTTERR